MKKEILKLEGCVKRNVIGAILNMVVSLLCALLLAILLWLLFQGEVFITPFYVWMNPEKHTAFSAFATCAVGCIWTIMYWASVYGGVLCFERSFKFLIRYIKSKKALKAEKKVLEDRNNVWNFFLSEARIKSSSSKKQKQLQCIEIIS